MSFIIITMSYFQNTSFDTIQEDHTSSLYELSIKYSKNMLKNQFIQNNPLKSVKPVIKNEPRRFNSHNKLLQNPSNNLCCICNSPNLLQKCLFDDCINFYHNFCVNLHFPDLKNICPQHFCKDLTQINQLTSLGNSFNSDKNLQTILKSKKKGD